MAAWAGLVMRREREGGERWPAARRRGFVEQVWAQQLEAHRPERVARRRNITTDLYPVDQD